jgi:hypothetical protein
MDSISTRQYLHCIGPDIATWTSSLPTFSCLREHATCYLGDYGAAAKTGNPIQERTIQYYPKDADFEAKEETDMYLLAVTLLEMFGLIPRASQRNDSFTKREIHQLIATTAVVSEQVRDFASSLFADATQEEGSRPRNQWSKIVFHSAFIIFL